MPDQAHPNGDDAADALGTWIQSIGMQADRTTKKLATLSAQATSTAAVVQTAAKETAAAITSMTAGVTGGGSHGHGLGQDIAAALANIPSGPSAASGRY